jgi:hypothetical protein
VGSDVRSGDVVPAITATASCVSTSTQRSHIQRQNQGSSGSIRTHAAAPANASSSSIEAVGQERPSSPHTARHISNRAAALPRPSV